MPTSISSDVDDLKRVVVAAAREAGVSAVRIAAADDDVTTRERMRASFARGDLATWGYGESYARRAAAPRELLPGVRSVVCVAVAYPTPPPPVRAPLTGRVSNYAWSADYHASLRAVLERIAEALDRAAGAPVSAIACDIAPLAERAFAARAGLGWVGKHTNLIAPGLGSFVFLGEVLTTLRLPPDPPLKKTCGACARCIDVCPTGALRGDYTIDARRCISDLTQRTDAIPPALRPLVGNWVWGCDLCQEICPPTRRAAPRVDSAFAPRDPSAAFPDLLALLRLTAGEFRRRYRRTAMGWRGPAVLRRNAAVALGNSLDRAAVPALAAALEADPNPLVRGHVAWALGRIGSPQALAALRRRRTCEPSASVCDEIERAGRTWETLTTWPALKSGRKPSP